MWQSSIWYEKWFHGILFCHFPKNVAFRISSILTFGNLGVLWTMDKEVSGSTNLGNESFKIGCNLHVLGSASE